MLVLKADAEGRKYYERWKPKQSSKKCQGHLGTLKYQRDLQGAGLHQVLGTKYVVPNFVVLHAVYQGLGIKYLLPSSCANKDL